MGTEIYAQHGLYVTRVAAPASEGADRRRWELYTPYDPVRLDRRDLLELLRTMAASIDLTQFEAATAAGITVNCELGRHNACGGYAAPFVHVTRRPCSCPCHLDGMDGRPVQPRVPLLVGDTLDTYNARVTLASLGKEATVPDDTTAPPAATTTTLLAALLEMIRGDLAWTITPENRVSLAAGGRGTSPEINVHDVQPYALLTIATGVHAADVHEDADGLLRWVTLERNDTVVTWFRR